MIFSVPAHKQDDPTKKPGQIVNPIPENMLYKPAHGGYPTYIPPASAVAHGRTLYLVMGDA